MENNIPIASDELVTALVDSLPSDSDELTHWGIKGMKWGVRRYQNADGSLTPAGEKRREKLEGKLKKLGGGDDGGSSGGKAKAPEANVPKRKKSVEEMDDDELSRAVIRGRLENEYRKQYPEPVKKPGLKETLVNDVVKPALLDTGKNLAKEAMSNLLKKKVDPDSLEAMTAVRDKLKIATEIDEYKRGGKYNWENMLKKQQYENEDSRRRGYKDAADEAKQKRDKDAADKAAKEAKAAADKAAKEAKAADKQAAKEQKAANKQAAKEQRAKDRAEYAEHLGKNWMSWYNDPASAYGSAYASSLSKDTISSGENYVKNISNNPYDLWNYRWDDE